jgi:hypothetical protein
MTAPAISVRNIAVSSKSADMVKEPKRLGSRWILAVNSLSCLATPGSVSPAFPRLDLNVHSFAA